MTESCRVLCLIRFDFDVWVFARFWIQDYFGRFQYRNRKSMIAWNVLQHFMPSTLIESVRNYNAKGYSPGTIVKNFHETQYYRKWEQFLPWRIEIRELCMAKRSNNIIILLTSLMVHSKFYPLENDLCLPILQLLLTEFVLHPF